MPHDEKDDLREDGGVAIRHEERVSPREPPASPREAPAGPYVAVASLAKDAAAPRSNEAPGRVSREALREFVAQPEVQERIRTIVAARVGGRAPKAVIDDIVQETNLAILGAASRPRSMETASGWVATVTARAVATHFRRSAAGLRWIEPEADVDEQAAALPETPGEGWLIGEWLAPILREHGRDQETYELLVYKATNEKSHDEVAADHAMTTAALKSRIHEFKKKYEPRWRRRQAMLLLILFGGVALVVTAGWLVARLIRPPEGPPSAPHGQQIAPVVPPVVAPPVTNSAFDAPFEPAQSTKPPSPPPPSPEPPSPQPQPGPPQTGPKP
jgi:DNA-directed RNA polymerase specialized sigma24 family protein